ncbi:ABC transporter permease [Anaerotignum propionicum]|uniref:Glycine betaine/carnitine/choline transport system permease protein OpuCD n=1 Tax=Anaerotignum propionicum DSM 1682 TaxID=991789 RepID=A0A0X8VCM9_ANAPI|nr:ABC transporter permease [Anaerotignum propionicum]AMJ42493.1 glycine betaine/carnitine/choline transport system permease protein OpuCD [Anaerotignum propionicum DSM 1682]MEA5056682.1 ABC transporter permease [Anaerotignum propionicum]SHE33201.1 osmoprotectant transport system permease protein [[Clostridium] propionicum DSM 1682] [Anaerotignum propionicum DSM 1682]HBF66288.1 ABC transporter permease [Clostridium sp.]
MTDLFSLTIQHMVLVLIAIGFSTIIGIFLGIISYWVPYLDKVILWVVDSLQTIPSLALLAILMIFFGLGNVTLVVGLILYSLLPIVRNTYLGLTGVPLHLKDAARGMGMSKLQRMIKVELPLSFPLIFSGIKIATVTALSIAVIGVLIGSGGLGYPIYRGIQTMNFSAIMKGTIPVVVMAVLFDLIMSKFEQKLVKRAK